jgi:hypothetical protein
MSSRLCLLALTFAAVTLACGGQGSQPVSPSSSGAVSSAPLGASFDPLSAERGSAGVSAVGSTVGMFDKCDPATFNAALGPGTCVGSGRVTFASFIDQLTRMHFVPDWAFAPSSIAVRVGGSFTAINRGGEVHTFTEVEDFGEGSSTS